MSPVLLTAIWLSLSALVAVCAATKGYNGLVFFGMSLIASPFLALPAILLAPRRVLPVAQSNPIDVVDAVTTCGRCSSKVLRTSGCCLQCGEIVPTARVIPFPQISAAPRF